MSLRDKIKALDETVANKNAFAKYGVVRNPFPSASQTANQPHFRTAADDYVDSRIVSFLRDGKSQVVVIEGTQGVGKTNLLNFFEIEIQSVLQDLDGYYLVRYLADPEASFEGTIRRLFQELGASHLEALASKLRKDSTPLQVLRSHDMRAALYGLINGDAEAVKLMMDWLLGFRLLKSHRETLEVQFRLDTVESKTAALRDLVLVSSACGILKGIFLLLDELEKQDGVLGPTAVVRYLSAMRAIIDALPDHLFMMIAVTPDAMRRYSVALPAFRSRLQNQITLTPLMSLDEAAALTKFYLETARQEAAKGLRQVGGDEDIVTSDEVAEGFEALRKAADRRGDAGVRQRQFLHFLHTLAETRLQSAA